MDPSHQVDSRHEGDGTRPMIQLRGGDPDSHLGRKLSPSQWLYCALQEYSTKLIFNKIDLDGGYKHTWWVLKNEKVRRA